VWYLWERERAGDYKPAHCCWNSWSAVTPVSNLDIWDIASPARRSLSWYVSTSALIPSQEVGSAWVSLSLVGCRCTGKGVFQRNPSWASKIYWHKACQITHIHTTVNINSGCPYTAQRASAKLNVTGDFSVAHTVGLHCGASLSANCSYNPGWCRSHLAVSKMTSLL